MARVSFVDELGEAPVAKPVETEVEKPKSKPTAKAPADTKEAK
jgi:hypothetical protein